MTTFGERLRAMRMARKWTQLQLGVRIGVDQTQISNYENGRIHPQLATIERMASALNVSVDMLLNGNARGGKR